jgi:histidine kinase
MSNDLVERAGEEPGTRVPNHEYRQMFDDMPNPVFVLDKRSLKVLDCSRSAKSYYGYEKEEILGASFLKFFDEAEHQNFALEIRNSSSLHHVPQITKSGRTIFVNIHVSPGAYLDRPALLVTCSDLIAMMVAKRQLIQASKMATLGEMATGMAHELNQPLSVIKTVSSFLLNMVHKGQQIRPSILENMLGEIDTHVDRASGIIAHIREFGRKSRGKKEQVQVNAPLRRALDVFTQRFKLKEIQVERELADDLPPILADQNRLEQVFINLLLNAGDAIEEKRKQVGPTNALPQKILVRSSLQGAAVRVEVRDTGAGIPEAVLNRIFEPFFTTKEIGKGTGLGLAISYGIVRDHEGTLQVESVEGEGSTFIIQFPAQVEAND